MSPAPFSAEFSLTQHDRSVLRREDLYLVRGLSPLCIAMDIQLFIADVYKHAPLVPHAYPENRLKATSKDG